MELSGNSIEDEQTFKINLRQAPNSIQRWWTNLSSTKRGSDSFGNNYRWSEDSSEYICGRSLPILHDQHRTNTAKSAISRGTDKISFSTSATIGKMDNTFGDKFSTNSNRNQCNVEVHSTEDHQGLVRSDVNRHQTGQKIINFSSTEPRPNEPASPPTRRENENCDSIRALGIRQLCRDNSFGPSSVLEEELASQIALDLNEISGKREATLQKLPQDLETKYSQDIPSLLSILTSIYPFDETSSNVLYDYEVKDFFELYGISNIHPILISDDDYVCWLEDAAGVIYMWSRIDDTMLYVGQDLREALINYLFHHDNICYVIEFTHEIIPINEVRQKAKECKWITWEVTKELLKPLKKDGKKKKGKKKKGKKKKNKH